MTNKWDTVSPGKPVIADLVRNIEANHQYRRTKALRWGAVFVVGALLVVHLILWKEGVYDKKLVGTFHDRVHSSSRDPDRGYYGEGRYSRPRSGDRWGSCPYWSQGRC